MKFTITAAILSIALPLAYADLLPEIATVPPTELNVKDRIAPPANATLFEVYYAKGNRFYQCNPEKKGFGHWYNVQTHAFLYPTKDEVFPFEREGKEIGQLSAAPLDPSLQMSNPMMTMPVLYNYRDGSWASTAKPLATTTKEEGRAERGDGVHLDDHVAPVVKSSTDGYLSHAKYIVRLNSIDGVVPAAETCTKKGLIINKPFTAYFMLYTDEEGVEKLADYKADWAKMEENYTPEKLALLTQNNTAPAGVEHKGPKEDGVEHKGPKEDGVEHKGPKQDGVEHKVAEPKGVEHKGPKEDGVEHKGPREDGVEPKIEQESEEENDIALEA